MSRIARREKGEGTLYQAKDKSWVYQYSVDGKRKTKRFRRKTDAKAFMAALATGQTEISVEKPSIVPQQAEPITVGEWMDRWLEKYAKPIVKLSTYCSYEQLIRSHVKPQIGSRYMSTMTGEDLQDFFNERREQGNLRRKGGLSIKTLTNLPDVSEKAKSGLQPGWLCVLTGKR